MLCQKVDYSNLILEYGGLIDRDQIKVFKGVVKNGNLILSFLGILRWRIFSFSAVRES